MQGGNGSGSGCNVWCCLVRRVWQQSREGGEGCGGSAGQIIRAAVRDEGWPTCKQVTSVLDDNS